MASLTKIGQLYGAAEYLDRATSVFVSGNYAYVTGQDSDALVIIDITNKSSPSRVGQLTGSYMNGPTGIFVDGDYAYVTSWNSDAFVIVDITTKTNPVRLGVVTGLGGASRCYISGDYAYVTVYDSDEFAVIDISNKLSPSKIGSLTGAVNYLNGAADVTVEGDYAYVASILSDALVIIDITTKTSPSMTGYISNSTLNGASGVSVDGDYAYVCGSASDKAIVIDISNKTSPIITDSLGPTRLVSAYEVALYDYYMFVAATDSDSLTVVDTKDKSDISESCYISGSGNYLNGIRGVFTDDGHYIYAASNLSDAFVIFEFTPDIPDSPSNLSVTSDMEENEISWDPSLITDSYNLYWMKYEYFADDFSEDLSGWDVYKDTGTETVQISSEKLYGSNTVGTNWHVVNTDNLPSGDFDIQVDLVTYTPDNNNNGLYAVFKVLDEYPFAYGDGAEIYYYVSSGGSQYNISANLWINGSNYDTSITIAGQPSKFRITRVGTTVSIYYYISSWVQIDSRDFGAYAPNLVLATIDGIQNSGNGGILEFDNFDYYVDVVTSGTKIPDVTSPYTHSSLDAGYNYIYVVTAENLGGESEASNIDNGIPAYVIPDAPTGISVEGDDCKNIISFTTDPEADQTNLYWDTTSGVTTSTGIQISDISSPYTHHGLDPEITYYYILTSENEYGESSPTIEYSSSPTPSAPVFISTESGIDNIIITWTDSTGADSYNLYWDTTSGVTTSTGTKISDVTSPYTHSGLVIGQTIYYILTAEDEDGESAASYEFNETVGLIGIPENPNADNTGNRRITITWDPVDDATFYNIYWLKTSGVTKETGNKIIVAGSPYLHQNLDPDEEYFYVVTAANASLESDESSEVSDIAYRRPTIPENIDATASLYSVIITWDDSTGDQDYILYWDTTSGVSASTENFIEAVTSPYRHYTPSHLIPFYYILTGVTGVFESDESSEVNATPYIESYSYPDQERSIDSFSDNRFSSTMMKVTKMATLNNMVLFPDQTFKMTIDSTSEITIGEGIFIKDNIIVHIQEIFTLDFSNNDYYLDSTGDMEEEGYYYIVIKYEYDRQRPGPKASYYIIRDTYLYDSSQHIFLGTARVVNSGGVYIISNVYTHDPLDQTMRRPTIGNAATMTIDAGEL